jgi:hypothetical protein
MKTSEEADQVGQQTEPAQGMHGCLCWLRLLLSVHIRHERDVYKRKVFATDTELELSQRLYKWCRFDIADRSAELAIYVNKEEAREYIKSTLTSTMQRSGSSPVSSTGILDTLSIQSWMASVTWGTILQRTVYHLYFGWINPGQANSPAPSAQDNLRVAVRRFVKSYGSCQFTHLFLYDLLIYLSGCNIVVTG